MRRVDEITGQERTAETVVAILSQSHHGIAALIGPEGSGKTRTAALAAAGLQEKHRVVFRRGDHLLTTSPEAMLLGPPIKAVADEVGGTILDVAQDVADLVAEGTIPFARTLRRLFKLKAKSDRRLSQRQQSFIFEVSPRSKSPVLLIADNLHYWDSESLHFLAQIHRGEWDSAYPSLNRLRTILVWTPEQAPDRFAAEIRRLFGPDLHVEALSLVNSTDFSELLTALGAPEGIPVELVDEIYGASGGHLLFANQIVQLLKAEPGPPAAGILQQRNLMTAVCQTIEARLDRAGTEGDFVRRMLQALSIIGDAAGLQDLRCVLADDRSRLDWTLDQALRLGLVERTADEVIIAHDVIRRVFLAFLTPDQALWHSRFAECIAKLRPWDYWRRAMHLTAAGDDDSAQAIRVMGLLQRVRDMRIKATDDWVGPVSPLSASVSALVVALQSAAVVEAERRYDEAIAILEASPRDLLATLTAERDLVLARLLLLKRTSASCERGLGLLEDLGAFRESEPDLWLRIEELRIVLLAYLGRYDQARQVEVDVRSVLHGREGFDPIARHVENRLRRRSESIHAPRIANDRLRRALFYFDPSGDGSAPRDLLEYLLTLNNLGANELVIGSFDSAFERFARCFQLMEATSQPQIKRVEIVLSNLVVAHYLKTGVVPQGVRALAEATAEMDILGSDAALVRSNLSGLLALQGRPDEAREILTATATSVLSVEGFSAYTIYFVCSNQAVIEWLHDADAVAGTMLDQATQALASLEPDFMPYAKRRLDILRQAMSSTSNQRTLLQLDVSFRPGLPQIGEGWRLYGRAIGLTDLQFWTES